MSRANPKAAIASEEQLVPSANRLKITKNNQRVASDSNITDSFLKLAIKILKHHKLYKPISLTTTSTGSFASYIILSDLKTEDVASPTVPDSDIDTESFEVPASPDYTLGSNIEAEPFKEDPQEAGLEESS
ncbi:hypothetical protein Tco_0500096 [Tanacetum coccineum]